MKGSLGKILAGVLLVLGALALGYSVLSNRTLGKVDVGVLKDPNVSIARDKEEFMDSIDIAESLARETSPPETEPATTQAPIEPETTVPETIAVPDYEDGDYDPEDYSSITEDNFYEAVATYAYGVMDLRPDIAPLFTESCISNAEVWSQEGSNGVVYKKQGVIDTVGDWENRTVKLTVDGIGGIFTWEETNGLISDIILIEEIGGE